MFKYDGEIYGVRRQVYIAEAVDEQLGPLRDEMQRLDNLLQVKTRKHGFEKREDKIAGLLAERDALRNTLVALAPDLKVMAILYQQQGQSQRAQALMAIRESLGLGE